VAARTLIAGIAAAGLFTLAAAGTPPRSPPPLPPPDAPADPGAPDPAPPPATPAGADAYVPIIGAPLGSNGLDGLAQRGDPSTPGHFGLPDSFDYNPADLIGQNAKPSPPGGVAVSAPSLNAFNNAYALPQNEKPSAPGQGTQVGVAPGDENSDISGTDYLRELRTLYHNGNLKGGLLGQTDQSQLGAPLPDTAPPPGTNLPPGIPPPPPDN
jgi:hypothetical protein